MLNFPISHAESLIEEEISSSQPICSLASSDSPADQSYPSFNGLGMSNQYDVQSIWNMARHHNQK